MGFLNGLAAAGSGLANFAAATGLESQRADAAQALQRSGGDIAATAAEKLAGVQGNLMTQKAALEQQQAVLADQLATAREASGRTQAGGIAAEAAKLADARLTAREVGGRTQAGDIAATAAEKEQAALQRRTETTANADTPEIKNAKFRSGATPEERAAQDEIMPGRARYQYLPVTKPSPDDPSKTISGVMKMDTHGVAPPEFIQTDTNPNKTGAGGMGNRAEVYYKRLAAATDMATAASENIMQLPSSSSTGLFGGRNQGGSLMAAAKEALTNAMTSQEVQDYNVMATGIARNLSAIETQGLAPTGSFTKSLDSVLMKEGDSYYTKLRKMAEIRQIVTEGMKANMSDPKIPTEQKKALQESLDRLAQAIPFTHADITKLQYGKGTETLADVMRQKGLGGKEDAGAPTPGATIPAWVKPGDQYSPSRGQARGADGAIYGPP